MASKPIEPGLVEIGMSVNGQYTAEELELVGERTRAIMMILRDLDQRPLLDVVGSVVASIVSMFDNPDRALLHLTVDVSQAVDEIMMQKAGMVPSAERRPN